MSEQIELILGSSIATHIGWGRGKVGGIVSDQEGRLFGLTAAHTLSSETDGRIYCDGALEPIGQRVDLPSADGYEFDDNDCNHFFATIGCFELTNKLVAASNSLSHCSVVEVVDPYDVIGERVVKVAEGALSYPGRVVSFGKSVKFVNPFSHESCSLRGVIEIEFESACQLVMAPGQVGSLVVDTGDRAVGILIGHSAGKCFAAPLAPFLAMHRLTLCAPGAPLVKQAAVSDLSTFLAAELRETKAGIQKMKQDIMSEGDSYAYARMEVPRHLIELLEGAA